MSEAYVNRLRQAHIRLEEATGHPEHILPVPAAYVVDTEGHIRFAYVNPDYRVRIKAEVLLAAARAER